MKPSFIQQPNHGFSFVEVLVTMLMVASAVLGSAGLQSTSLRQGQNIRIDSQAADFAQELKENILAYEDPTAPGIFASTVLTEASSVNCYSAPCTHPELVQHLMWQWRDHLQKTLPLADYQLKYSDIDRNYRLHIVWDAEGDGVTEIASASGCVGTTAAGRGQYCLLIYPNG